jgi:formate hydrogenlyase subunit 3/multisubunit Na+/H+ antiporter MnhD subunit
MANPIIILFASVLGVYALWSAASVRSASVPFFEQRDVQTLLLKAAGARALPPEPGTIRVPIYVDGVVYEVIGVSPDTVARLVPVKETVRVLP